MPVAYWIGLRVAPHAGAWIETAQRDPPNPPPSVAPHAGAWIETAEIRRENGDSYVAPHAGAWIETSRCAFHKARRGCPPRGGMD